MDEGKAVKSTIKTFFLCLCVCISVSAYPEENKVSEGEKSIITEKESGSVLKGAIFKAWQRLRSLSPKSKENYNQRRLAATAGIRGAESTDTVLKPYWKDDRTQDKDFLAQLEAYAQAQDMIEEGRFSDAVKGLDTFMSNFPTSQLLPNALFAKGLALGADNNAAGAKAVFSKFVADYPEHPMVVDAKEVVSTL